MEEHRCGKCGKKLGLLTAPFEIKCQRCKTLCSEKCAAKKQN